MSLIEHPCEVCERPRGEDAFIGAEGEDICARCAAELLGAERDDLRQQLRGTVGTLEGVERYLNDALCMFESGSPTSARAYVDSALADLRRLGGQ